MSRYIETAHNVLVLVGLEPGGTNRDQVRPTQSAQRLAFPLRTKVLSSHDRRLVNMRENVSRCEANLSAARTSPAHGSRSAGLLRQLTRRLHEAKVKLAGVCEGVLAPGHSGSARGHAAKQIT